VASEGMAYYGKIKGRGRKRYAYINRKNENEKALVCFTGSIP